MNYKKMWDKYTEGWTGTIIYLVLGFLIAYGLNIALGYALHTETPVVAVFSCSMEHTRVNNWYCGLPSDQVCGKKIEADPRSLEEYWNICGSWYESNGISKDIFNSFVFNKGLTVGDMIVVYGGNDVSVGNIIIFNTNVRKYPIIHRIYKINPDGAILTKGDNNEYPDNWSPEITKSNINGKAVLKIPLLGWVKILFVEITGLA